MAKIDIWVEGVADQKFIADLLNSWYGLVFNKKFECRDNGRQIEVNIRQSGGVTSFISEEGWYEIESIFKENEVQGVKNLAILDADESFEQRKSKVNQTITAATFSIETDLFLWPYNQHAGDLENLLEQIINPENKSIFECWEAYEECLKNTPGKTFTLPARKTKIYAYLEALLGETNKEKEKIKEREREYTNQKHWILGNSSGPLKYLKKFLDSHLQE